MTTDEQRAVFEQSFYFEQEVTVAPGVAQTVAQFACPIMRALCLRPLVRFAFFPYWKYMLFKDFSRKEERISKGLQTYEIAQRKGWQEVFATLRQYGRLPESFFDSPTAALDEIKADIAKAGRVAGSL
jgi:hypothetical protein